MYAPSSGEKPTNSWGMRGWCTSPGLRTQMMFSCGETNMGGQLGGVSQKLTLRLGLLGWSHS